MSRIGLGFPGIFQQWIAFPCSQVPAIFAVATVSYDLINFILFFEINHVGRRLGEVGPMCVSFLIRGKKSGVEESEEEEDLIWCVRERSRAWMTIGSGTMVTSTLSSAVSMRSFQERVSVGAICVPGVIC